MIRGGSGSDALRGGVGTDTIYGGAGTDTINGGADNDSLYGSDSKSAGDGVRDTFVFNSVLSGSTNLDTVYGFEAGGNGGTGVDKVFLDSSIFGSIANGAVVNGGPGLEASEFKANVGGDATDTNDYILFDTKTGTLYYDADGNGVGAKVAFLVIDKSFSGTVDYTDFQFGTSP
jgi:Ca2+-binding RTX toxin-like protein